MRLALAAGVVSSPSRSHHPVLVPWTAAQVEVTTQSWREPTSTETHTKARKSEEEGWCERQPERYTGPNVQGLETQP